MKRRETPTIAIAMVINDDIIAAFSGSLIVGQLNVTKMK